MDGAERASKIDTATYHTLTTVKDEQFKGLFAQDVILTGIRTAGRQLSEREVFDLLLPVAVES